MRGLLTTMRCTNSHSKLHCVTSHYALRNLSVCMSLSVIVFLVLISLLIAYSLIYSSYVKDRTAELAKMTSVRL